MQRDKQRKVLFAVLLLVATLAMWSALASAQTELSEKDQKTLERGEYSTGECIIGGFLAVVPGLGVGHVFQERWKDRGWVFTLGELAYLGFAIPSIDLYGNRGSSNTADYVVVAGILALKAWEILDAWVVPPIHNRRYRRLREETRDISILLAPYRDNSVSLTIQIRF